MLDAGNPCICYNGCNGRILRELDLINAFEVIVGGDCCAQPKPDPSHLLTVLALLGIGPDRAVYVGDSEVDAIAAAAGGVPFFFVTFGYCGGPPEAIKCHTRIESFNELITSLQAVAGPGSCQMVPKS